MSWFWGGEKGVVYWFDWLGLESDGIRLARRGRLLNRSMLNLPFLVPDKVSFGSVGKHGILLGTNLLLTNL